MITADKEFIFEQNGQRIVAPLGSEIYVLVQDYLDGDVGTFGMIRLPIENIKKEIGKFNVGKVSNLKMSNADVLIKCHTAVKAGLTNLNPTVTFTESI